MLVLEKYLISEIDSNYLYSLMYKVEAFQFLILYLMKEEENIHNNKMLQQYKDEYLEYKQELNMALECCKRDYCKDSEILNKVRNVEFNYSTKELILYGM